MVAHPPTYGFGYLFFVGYLLALRIPARYERCVRGSVEATAGRRHGSTNVTKEQQIIDRVQAMDPVDRFVMFGLMFGLIFGS